MSHSQPLRRGDLDADPLAQFSRWFEAAGEAGTRAPEAMALATAALDGRPSVRMVLLKAFGEPGFVFYTGYASRKGRELEANPWAALLFHWDLLGRQVRVEGSVERVSAEESAAYFGMRPRGSRIAAWASRQSEPLASREALEARVGELASEHEGRDVPRPAFWGGFRVRPASFEFWQHRDDRLHDRFLYRPSSDGGWTIERLSP